MPERDARLERVHQHFMSLEQNYLKALEELRDAEQVAMPEDGNRELQRVLIDVQRRSLAEARREQAFDAEVLRKMEGQLDLEEMRMNN